LPLITSIEEFDCKLISIILPAYNEEEALPPLLDSIEYVKECYLPNLRVFVVDDGSADSTPAVVTQRSAQFPWVQLVQHESNQGLSGAIQSGFQAALRDAKPDDIVVTLDADNTQPPEIIPDMAMLIDHRSVDVVVASRFRKGAEVHGVPAMRRVYSRIMSILFQLAFPVHGVRDYSCGFRAYRAGVLQQAYATYGDTFITERGFACMVEILFQLSRLGDTKFAEVPFVLRYDLKPTETKMRVVKTITDTLRVAMKYRFMKPPQKQVSISASQHFS
jgi:dolichol-phosphate mannosyltransferase